MLTLQDGSRGNGHITSGHPPLKTRSTWGAEDLTDQSMDAKRAPRRLTMESGASRPTLRDKSPEAGRVRGQGRCLSLELVACLLWSCLVRCRVMASPRDPTTHHLDGRNLKVTFLDGQLFVMDGLRDGAIHNRPCRFFLGANLPVHAILQCH